MATSSYLDSIRKQFSQYRQLGETSLQRLEAPQLTAVPAPGSNSVAVIVRHLHGTMLSRWTAFLTEDGEKPWRNRDAEFEEPPAATPATVLQQWNEGWDCLIQALEPLSDADLDRTIRIRGEAHSIAEALHRQLTHYAFHVGQIVYLAKMFSGEAWESLSIPRGGSHAYNERLFGQTGNTSAPGGP